ncbi:MAG: hypothetical protein WA821_22710 [Anaerolineales bacterium]
MQTGIGKLPIPVCDICLPAYGTLLSSVAKYRRNWVRPNLLMLRSSAAFRLFVYQPTDGILLKYPTRGAEIYQLQGSRAEGTFADVGLLFSLDSRIQPSCATMALNVRNFMPLYRNE